MVTVADFFAELFGTVGELYGTLAAWLMSNPVVVVVGVVILFVLFNLTLSASSDSGSGIVEETSERTFGQLAGFILGIATVGSIAIAELTSIVAETPGFFSAAAIGAWGYAGLSGILSISPRAFAVGAALVIVAAIAIREA